MTKPRPTTISERHLTTDHGGEVLNARTGPRAQHGDRVVSRMRCVRGSAHDRPRAKDDCRRGTRKFPTMGSPTPNTSTPNFVGVFDLCHECSQPPPRITRGCFSRRRRRKTVDPTCIGVSSDLARPFASLTLATRPPAAREGAAILATPREGITLAIVLVRTACFGHGVTIV